MDIRNVLRPRSHGEKRVIFLDWTAQARKLEWPDKKALVEKFTHAQLLELVQASIKEAQARKFKMENYTFFIPNEPKADGVPFDPKVAIESLRDGRVLSCKMGKFSKPKLTFGDKDWKPAAKKTSVIEDIDY